MALPRRLPLTLALVAGLATVLCADLGRARVLLHGCVDPGWWAPLGVRLDVLDDAAACPQGSYGLGVTSRGAVLLLSVAVPVLVAHLVALAGGVTAAAVLHSWVRALSGAVRRVLRVPSSVPALPVAAPVPAAGPVPVRHARVGGGGTVALRGPPAAV